MNLPENLKQWHYSVSDNVKSSELREGDLVVQFGVVFKLSNHREYEKSKGEHSNVHLFDTKPIGYWNRKDQCSFPEEWMNDFPLQGNDLATREVVKDNSYPEEVCDD